MLIFHKSICCFFRLFSSQNAAPDSFHLFCLFKTPASSFPFLCLCSLSPLSTSAPTPLTPPHLTLTFTPFLGLFFGGTCHFSCRFLTPAQDMKGLFFCVWESGGRGGGRGRWRGERKSLMFVIKTTDCLISVQSL